MEPGPENRQDPLPSRRRADAHLQQTIFDPVTAVACIPGQKYNLISRK